MRKNRHKQDNLINIFINICDFKCYKVKSSTFILNTFAAKIAGFSLEVPFSILVFFSLFGSYLGAGLVKIFEILKSINTYN